MAGDEDGGDPPVTAAALRELRDAARADREVARAARLEALREAAALLTRARNEFDDRSGPEREALRRRLLAMDERLEELEQELRLLRRPPED